jgi:hypothetical protein
MSSPAERGSSIFKSVAPQFVVPDVARTAQHYRESYGFDIASSVGDPPAWAMLTRDRVEIQLARGTGGVSNATVRADAFDAYIRVIDIEALYQELSSKHATIVEGPVTRPYGMREIVVSDCNGYRLVFGAST